MRPQLLTVTGLIIVASLQSYASNTAAKPASTLSVQEISREILLSKKKLSSHDIRKFEANIFSKCYDCEDKKALEKARKLFEGEKYLEAIETYNKIPKGSSYWLTATEEKAWSYFRLRKFDQAIAQGKTLLSPQFDKISGIEAYFLMSLSQLQNCDYRGVLATHTRIKESFKERILTIQDLADTGDNSALKDLLERADRFPLNQKDIAFSLEKMPLLFFRDIELQKQVFRYRLSSALIAQKQTDSSAFLLGLQEKSLSGIKRRLKDLAKDESNQNFDIVQKLNLIEADVIQRIHTDLELSEEKYTSKSFDELSDDKLMFMDDGQPWIDEVDKFDVASKACKSGIRRKM